MPHGGFIPTPSQVHLIGIVFDTEELSKANDAVQDWWNVDTIVNIGAGALGIIVCAIQFSEFPF